MTVQEILLDIMRENCWDQQELAKGLQVEASQVSRWLSGKSTPRLETYNAIKEKYDQIKSNCA